MSEFIFKGRLDGGQRYKLKGLFDMLYTPKELADAIGMHVDQVYYVYVPFGCPHDRDEKKHISINGKSFAGWYLTVYAKLSLANNETFCLTCKKGVEIFQPKETIKNGLVYLLSVCPVCGRKLTKIIANKGKQNDK